MRRDAAIPNAPTVTLHDDHPPSFPLWHEPLLRVWARRAVTIPGLFVITALFVALFPVVLLVAVANDVARRVDWHATRGLLALGSNLVMHCVGVGLMFLVWVAGGRWLGLDPERERRWDVRLEVWWTTGGYRSVERFFRMKHEVEGADQIEPGPLIVFPRHASIIDILLPFALVAAPTGMRLRYVVKRELVYDPCVDIIGHRLPFAFVRRGTQRHAQQIEVAAHLADGLGERDAVVLYPEGTRFTAAKRAHRLQTLRESDPRSYERARRLEHVLAPHVGGPLAMLDRDDRADVLFLGHTGLEGANGLADLFGGVLLDRVVKVQFWRVPRSEVPEGPRERVDWLYDWWERVDQWIDANRSEGSRSESG